MDNTVSPFLLYFELQIISCSIMKNSFIALLLLYLPATAQQPAIIMTEQAQHRIIIVEPYTNKTIWEWKADSAHAKWFTNPSDAKVVYNGQYVITCASGGGVAMVRIKDKRTMFCVYAGGNTHSVELFPDGNLVSASTTRPAHLQSPMGAVQ
jgi:hypothetical protein